MKKADIGKLETLMERLRATDGCPWDREQTLGSLVPFIIEEAYEVVSAIDAKDTVEIKEELGDLLFQIIFCSRITEEAGAFGLADVIDTSYEKMVRRHPHVFGDSKADTPGEVLKRWAEIKKEEKKEKKTEEGYLAGIPEVLPALLRAHKVSQKAAKAGFDWKSVNEVMDKLTEETDEFRKAVEEKDAAGMEEELGDMLFTMVNVGRFLEVNPEDALRKTIGKFITRFHHIENSLRAKGRDLSSTPIEEMERLWQEAKRKDTNA
ncbi:MAG: nucleoside triphosphate pyrophosphohydrolase [Deltaproteobacteria bacterium]|nr:nucleoside triphosphate pyrophosphohydrolase [Deltaproteobacteria bacterium]